MGERAHIYITNDPATGDDPTRGIYFHTHWSGAEWPEILRQALKFGESRWDDEAQLVRILASRMFKDIEDQTGGGGISVTLGESQWPITIVNLSGQQIHWVSDDGDETHPAKWSEGISFADFVALQYASYWFS